MPVQSSAVKFSVKECISALRSWKCVDLPLLLGSVCVVFPEDRSWLRRKLRCCAPESGTCGRTSRRGFASSTIAYVECAHRASAAASLQMTWALGGQPTPCLCHQKMFFKQLLLPCTVLISRKNSLRSLFGTGATVFRFLKKRETLMATLYSTLRCAGRRSRRWHCSGQC